MTKNNLIPKENKAQIEEIREIENQIPTYEEFLKNYNANEKVSEGYENELNSYSYIGISKGFGPCAWRNNQYGERWTDLRIPCPVSGCPNTNIISQIHTCGGQIEISSRVQIRCQGCRSVGHVRNWTLSCSNHSGSYRSASQTDVSSFLNTLMVALNNREMDESVVMELVRNLRSY